MNDEKRPSKYLTAAAIAEELAISLSQARRIMRECPILMIGRAIRVSRSDFEAWKHRHEKPAPGRPAKSARASRPRSATGKPVDPLDVPIKVRYPSSH